MKKYLKMIATVICMTLLAGCQNTEETSALPETIKDTEIQEKCTEELANRFEVEETESEAESESNEEETTTEATETAAVKVTADWKQAYKAFIQSGAHIGGDSDDLYCIQSEADAGYWFSDVNLDGVPELFLNPGTADWRYELYTYYDGTVKLVDDCRTSVSYYFYDLEGTPYYYGMQDSSYGMTISLSTIINGQSQQLLCYTTDYPMYEQGWSESYKEEYYVGNDLVDRGTFEGSAKNILSEENYNKFINFELSQNTTEQIPVNDLTVIDNY